MNQQEPQFMEPGPGPEVQIPRRINPLAIAGFATAFVCGLAGMIISIIAYKQIARDIEAQSGWGFAKAGIGLGIGVTIVQLFYLIAMIASQ